MKVKIGGVQRSAASSTDLAKVENAISSMVVNGAVSSATELTPRILKRLEQRVRVAAMVEASRMMAMVVSLIDTPRRTGISDTDLRRGSALDLTGAVRQGFTLRGQVDWAPLTLNYALRKHKARRRNTNHMFRYNSTMRNYLKGRAQSIVDGRLGGIQVEVDNRLRHSYVSGGNNKLVGLERVDNFDASGNTAKVILGRVTLTMFPRLSPSLAPMLSTRRWTSSGNGQLERYLFGGTKTMHKFTNGRGEYRPLLTPVLQFFMLSRIPAAVNASVRDYMRRISPNAD